MLIDSWVRQDGKVSKMELLWNLKRYKAKLKGWEFDNVLNALEARITNAGLKKPK